MGEGSWSFQWTKHSVDMKLTMDLKSLLIELTLRRRIMVNFNGQASGHEIDDGFEGS
jgi:hypothetical protein